MADKHKPYGPYEKFFKRPLDLLFAVTVLVFFWWLYVIIAVLVRTRLGSPVLFVQERPGKDEKIFKMYKFRTMTDAKDENGNYLPDEVRLTKFGKLLRATSLDELPEILNIIKGDMSVIGPRPLLVKYLPYYYEDERTRHSIRPGLTGLAQVNGRNNLSWTERFKLDCEYANRITLIGDVAILLGTIRKVIKKSDIAVDGSYAMKNLDEERSQDEG